MNKEVIGVGYCYSSRGFEFGSSTWSIGKLSIFRFGMYGGKHLDKALHILSIYGSFPATAMLQLSKYCRAQ